MDVAFEVVVLHTIMLLSIDSCTIYLTQTAEACINELMGLIESRDCIRVWRVGVQSENPNMYLPEVICCISRSTENNC